jgi:hypothetical protein
MEADTVLFLWEHERKETSNVAAPGSPAGARNRGYRASCCAMHQQGAKGPFTERRLVDQNASLGYQ